MEYSGPLGTGGAAWVRAGSVPESSVLNKILCCYMSGEDIAGEQSARISVICSGAAWLAVGLQWALFLESTLWV